jgi:hypothetical protein
LPDLSTEAVDLPAEPETPPQGSESLVDETGSAEPGLGLEADADPLLEEADDSTWRLPDGVGEVIERFNAMHRVVYRAVRTEIGAGAVNFVRSCCGRVADETADLVEGVELRADGSWDVDGLKKVILAKRIEDPWPAYQRVLDAEFVSLQPHLSEDRAGELRRKILDIENAD